MTRNQNLYKTLMVLAMITLAMTAMAQGASTDTVAVAEPSWAENLYNWFKEHMNYWTIILLMAIESSIVPLPSEVVVPPAAYFSLQANSNLDFWLVIVTATVGAYLGSAINYGLSMLIGRPIFYKFADSRVGHALMLNREKLEHADLNKLCLMYYRCRVVHFSVRHCYHKRG